MDIGLLKLLRIVGLLLECLVSVVQIVSEKGSRVSKWNEFVLICAGKTAFRFFFRFHLEIPVFILLGDILVKQSG